MGRVEETDRRVHRQDIPQASEVRSLAENLPQSIQVPVRQAIRFDEDTLVIRDAVKKEHLVPQRASRILEKDDIIELPGVFILFITQYGPGHGPCRMILVRRKQVGSKFIILLPTRRNSNESLCHVDGVI